MPRWNNPNCGFQKGHPIYWKIHPMLGKKRSEKWKKKISKIMMDNENGFKKGIYQGYGFKKGNIPWDKNRKRPEMSNKNNPNWKGGITPENEKIRHNIEMYLWRGSVIAKNNWTCQKCGAIDHLMAHHIQNFSKFIELRTSIENGITLCKNCHIDFHKKYGKKNNTKEQIEEFLIK